METTTMDALINAWHFVAFVTDPVVIMAGVVVTALWASTVAPATTTLWQ